MHLEGLAPWGGLPEGEDIALVGIPYDGSAVYRRGAAGAPARLRELSKALPPVTERAERLSLRVHDFGDVELGESVEGGWKAAADRLAALPRDAFLTVLGGDHCTLIATLAAQARRHPGLALVFIDAHPDLNDTSRGGRWTCGCALRRALECAGMAGRDVAFAGLRDFDYEEVEFARTNEMLSLNCAEVARDPLGAGRVLAGWSAGRPVHVSFDIDVLDPAFAPGTEIPSAAGLSTRQALDLLTGLTEQSRLVGLDVTEVSPPLDPSDITVYAALKVIFETWGLALGNR
ncbi:MAG TPA: arginase family protein [Candidatus Dormibacteraeota bacterium]